MRIFLTGAAGHIGSAVVPELVEAGHHVIALARSESSATVATDLGAEARRGDTADLGLVADAAREADGTIHLAFDNDAALRGDLAGASEADLAVVGALGDALAGTGKALVAIGVGPTGDPAVDAAIGQNPRSAVARAVAGLTQRDVRAVLLGVPPVVHSTRDRTGFVPTLIALARRTGRSSYLGAGETRWPAVHTRDLGRLFRLAVESAPAGTQLLGAAEDDVTTRRVAEAIGEHLGLPAGPVAPEEAEAHFGGFALIMGLDFPPMTSAATRELLGWSPTRPGLLADLAEGHYFAAAGD